MDALRVAASFDIEDAVIAPAMFVVADQAAGRIGRERRLARARETEEERYVVPAPLTPKLLRSLVGRTVHGEHTSTGEHPVHDREHALLHLASVFRAQDHLLAALERQVDARAAGHLRRQRVRRKLTGVVDHVVGRAELVEFVQRGPDQHVVHEEGVVGAAAQHADLQPAGWIPAGVAVAHVDLVPRVEVVDGPLAVQQEGVVVDGMVDRSPPDIRLRCRCPYDVFILRAATGLLA